MKVLLVNGSSRKNGCTQSALNEVARALNEENIETEFFFIGNEALPDCIACRKCREIGPSLPLPLSPKIKYFLISQAFPCFFYVFFV